MGADASMNKSPAHELNGEAWLQAENLNLSAPVAQQFYMQMGLTRQFEEAILKLFEQNELAGTTHTSMGQEANAVGIVNAMDRTRDTIWSNHRCHGHFLAYCGDALGLMAEIMGRETGVCGGRGGSQHLCSGRFRSNGVQGGIVPLAVGSAMARRSEGAIATVFLGDGTMGEGIVYESLNMASLWSAPVLMVVEDNGIAQTTPKAFGVAGSIVERAQPFGVKTYAYAGTDVLAINTIAQEAVNFVRSEGRPAWFVIETHRIGPHSKGDDTRDATTIAAAQSADPLDVLADHLTPDITEQLVTRCRAIIDRAVADARKAPFACAS